MNKHRKKTSAPESNSYIEETQKGISKECSKFSHVRSLQSGSMGMYVWGGKGMFTFVILSVRSYTIYLVLTKPL
jgi:hypothetical protein